MNLVKKIILTIAIIFGTGLVPTKASSTIELNFAITMAQSRLTDSINVLKSINKEMCDIILFEKWTEKYNIANNYFLMFHRKEFNDYVKAVDHLENLQELYFYASMNDLSHKV